MERELGVSLRDVEAAEAETVRSLAADLVPPAGRAAIAPGSSFHIDDYRDSHSKDRRRILNIIGPGPSAYSHTPTEWRQTFAEAQLPYAKIMGCVQSLVHAGSLALKNQLRRGAMMRGQMPV